MATPSLAAPHDPHRRSARHHLLGNSEKGSGSLLRRRRALASEQHREAHPQSYSADLVAAYERKREEVAGRLAGLVKAVRA